MSALTAQVAEYLDPEGQGPAADRVMPAKKLGRALGHFIFSLIGLKRILFTNTFSKALKAPPRKGFTNTAELASWN